MTDISVRPIAPEEFEVRLTDPDGSSTHHFVRVESEAVDRFSDGVGAKELVIESFRFLLEREPKESILRAFELPVIARYHSDYPREMIRRLGSAERRAQIEQSGPHHPREV